MFDFPEIGLCQFQDYLKFNKCPFPNQTIFTFLTFWETVANLNRVKKFVITRP